jgi:hypothetical protein
MKVIGLMAVAAATLASTATAGTATVVSALGCASQGGAVTVPAGQIVVRQGWASGNLGLVRDFVNAQTTTVSVGGAPAVDVSGLWSTPEPIANGALSFLSYDTGTALAAGESLTFHLVSTLAHPVMDQEPGGTVQVTGTPIDFTCKVTAV